MGLRNLLRELKKERDRRKEPVRLHPVVGLPKEAPEYLETENGSFVRVLPEAEHLPLETTTPFSAVVYIVLALPAALGFFVFADSFAKGDDFALWFLPILLIGCYVVFRILRSEQVRWERSTRGLPKKLGSRRSRLFDPEDCSHLLVVGTLENHPDSAEPTHDWALVRVASGFLEIEMSRAQVRIAADDLRICLKRTDSWFSASMILRCDFGDCEWLVEVPEILPAGDGRHAKLNLFERWIPNLRYRAFARILQDLLELPGGDLQYAAGGELVPKVPIPFVFSSESEESLRRVREYRRVAFGAIFLAELMFLPLIIWGLTLNLSSSEPVSFVEWFSVSLCALLAVAFPLCFIQMLRSMKLGAWTFDEKKVTYEPLYGPTVEIAWEEIEHVRWEERKIELVGRKDTICLDTWSFGFAQFSRARQLIKRHLDSGFDLRMIPFGGGLVFRIDRAVLAILLLAGWIAASVGIENRYDDSSLLSPWMAVSLTVMLISGGTLAALLLLRFRRARTLNPKWRERKSRLEDTPA